MPSSVLPINRLVNVQVNLSPAAAQIQNLSTLLILVDSTVIDVNERFREYTSLSQVASDHGTASPAYLAAVLWFEQSPQPITLQIGRWAKTAVAAILRGGLLAAADQAISNFTAVVSGSFGIVVNGTPLSVTGLDFSAVTNLNGVASIVQAALAALSAGSTVVWNASYNRFEVTSGTTGATSTIGFMTAPKATGNFGFTGQPANLDTITLNGTVVTFVTGTPTGNQVQIGADLATTLNSLKVFLQASADVELVKFSYYLVGTTLYVASVVTGAAGDALTIAKSGTNITVSGATLSGGSGTDVSGLLKGLSTSGGAYVVDGIVAETALDAATLFDNTYGQNWYALTILGASTPDHQEVGDFIQASTNKHIYGVSTQDAGVLSSSSTVDVAYLLKSANLSRTVVQYSSSNPYSVCSLLARILTTNFNGNNTVITLMYKQEPGIVAEVVNISQLNILEGKNCNIFVAYNNDTAIIEKGVCSNGDFLDIITGTDWLALTIQNEVYNLLYTTTTKIPQTDQGNHLITTTIENVCAQGVVNGLLAPGVWQAGGFGSLVQNDFLPKGYYVYAPPIANQNSADRAARKSVTFQVAAKLAGAIHTVDVIINVNR